VLIEHLVQFHRVSLFCESKLRRRVLAVDRGLAALLGLDLHLVLVRDTQPAFLFNGHSVVH
jgi:hypothetical protein